MLTRRLLLDVEVAGLELMFTVAPVTVPETPRMLFEEEDVGVVEDAVGFELTVVLAPLIDPELPDPRFVVMTAQVTPQLMEHVLPLHPV